MCRSRSNDTLQWLTIAVSVLLLPACTSTRVVETNWDDQAVDELNRTCESRCTATVWAPDPTEIEASRLSIRNGILGIGEVPGGQIMYRAELHSVSRIAITRKRHGQGAIEGLGIGLAGGALLGAALAAGSWQPCDDTGFLACLMHPETRGAAARLGGVAGGIAGGVLGLFMGAIGGKKEVNVYVFRPVVPHPSGTISSDHLRGLADEIFAAHNAYELPRHVSE